VALAVVAVAAALILYGLYRWCRDEVGAGDGKVFGEGVTLECDDGPIQPPTELVARLDENGRVELTVDEPSPPLLKNEPQDEPAGERFERRRGRTRRVCQHCGRGQITRSCPCCRLKLCSSHPGECPECGFQV